MSLLAFVSSPEHFVARERLLHMKAALEMKMAAAHCSVQLQMTEPEIDNLGHDFIAAIAFDQVFLQNKATVDTAGVRSWDLNARFLQASFTDRDLAPVVRGLPVGGLEGAFGGFLLHEISADSANLGHLDVKYWYFDIIFANAVRTGLWKAAYFSPQQAEDLLDEIGRAERGEKICVKKDYMLPIKSPKAIVQFRFHLPRPSNWMSLGSKDLGVWPPEIPNLWELEVRQWTRGEQ